MVTVNNICVNVQGQQLLRDSTCTLLPGRITSFAGPSGAGKTTLLKTIIGLMPAQSGAVIVGGQPLAGMSNYERAQKIGYLFQDFNLFEQMTVVQNCIDPLLVHGVQLQDAQERVMGLLKKIGMESYAGKYPGQLSGGQKQRVAIARMLALQPKVILLDEPTASLDPVTTDILVGMLKQFAADGLTIGLSTQDMSFIKKIFDRVYYLEQGSVIELCDFDSQISNSAYLADFLGR